VIAQALRRLSFAAVLATLLAACGGSVGPSPNVVDPLVVTVQPATATIYPGIPTTILITGGTGSYVVASDNQAIVPIATPAVGHSLTVIANPVLADTTVTLTVRDTGATTAVNVPKTVTLNVRVGTVQNSITITPASNECSPALCSGGEALVSAIVAQGGIPLPARGVRFDVISGDVRFITTPVGTTPEQLSTSTITVTDQAGVARVRLRALALVANQSALIQITDGETGAFQRVVIPVVTFTGTGNPAFFAIPTEMTFTGPFIGQCAPNPTAGVGIFGGTPPYTILSTVPGTITVIPDVVPNNGGRFTINVFTSACFSNVPITITDAAGRTISVLVTNQEGTTAAPPPQVVVSPANLTLGCSPVTPVTVPPTPPSFTTATIVISGGATTGTFSAASGDPRFIVTIAGRTVTVMRAHDPVLATPPLPTVNVTADVFVTDGVTTARSSVTTPSYCL
jgi:hypothetical protein